MQSFEIGLKKKGLPTFQSFQSKYCQNLVNYFYRNKDLEFVVWRSLKKDL